MSEFICDCEIMATTVSAHKMWSSIEYLQQSLDPEVLSITSYLVSLIFTKQRWVHSEKHL